MKKYMCYTDEELAVIDGVLGTLYPRMPAPALKEAFWNVHEHIQAGEIDLPDLRRIVSALEFTDPGVCVSGNKESYREVTSILLKTKAMIRAKQ